MKTFLSILIIILFSSISAEARDEYFRANPKWRSSFNIKENVEVTSVWKLNDRQIKLIKHLYRITKDEFDETFGPFIEKCDTDDLKIRVVKSHHELNNREYFPGESTYADEPHEGNEIIFGRYYRRANTLYIVPPNFSEYYWKENFAHEILHYFFDICNIEFANNNKEHIIVDRFLRENKHLYDHKRH